MRGAHTSFPAPRLYTRAQRAPRNQTRNPTSAVQSALERWRVGFDFAARTALGFSRISHRVSEPRPVGVVAYAVGSRVLCPLVAVFNGQRVERNLLSSCRSFRIALASFF
eukprot:752996-Rhodomonas_salina.1